MPEFKYANIKQALDWILELLAITWQEFKKMDYIRGSLLKQKHATKGFSTPSRKFEILTDNAYATCDPAMGATNVRTLLCRIYAEERPS